MPPPTPPALSARQRWLRRLVLAGAAALGSALVIAGHLALQNSRNGAASTGPATSTDPATSGEIRFHAAYPLGATPPLTVVSNPSATRTTDPINP